MNKEFVTYEQALALKELGFDESCIAWFAETKEIQIALDVYKKWTKKPCNNSNIVSVFNTDCITAPLKSQVFRWFREKYGMLGVVNVAPQGFYYYDINKIDKYKEINQDVDFDSFEEAEDECINHIIKLIKKIV